MCDQPPFGNKRKELVIEESDFESSSDSTDDDHDQDINEMDENALSSLVALEKSLPMKRGLSSHYEGKSKSLDNLLDMEIEDMSELGKKEHPLNKKRRLIRSHDYLNKDVSSGEVPILPLPRIDAVARNGDKVGEDDHNNTDDQSDEGVNNDRDDEEDEEKYPNS